ncbi:MAG TPA: trypsin-like peptidase domain-containing protein [Mobilitalea sp.]|nr:trypsin-like peptidase domain-containing protein [Mobilitalea sp.]
MAEFDNNNFNNVNNGDNGMNNQNQGGKVPEYSFWAEQMPGNTYSNYNPRTNSWEYGNYPPPYQPNPNSEEKKSKPKRKALKFIFKAACFGIIAGISFFGLQALYFTINPEARTQFNNTTSSGLDLGLSAGKKIDIQNTQPGSVSVASKSEVSDVVDKTMPSIVSINCTSTQTNSFFGQNFNQDVQASGSGIIIAKNEKEGELLIATNNHVVEGANKISVVFIDGTSVEAVVKGTDATADLAVVSVSTKNMKKTTLDAIQVAKLGNSDQVKVGEMAVAIGNALGYGQSVTVGYISAKDREVDISDGYTSKKMILLQTDAAINPGNSGGALLNVNGEVIGINTVKYASAEVEGMGYAIPISKATPIINELMNREVLKQDEQGFMGITGIDVTEDVAQAYNMPVGVFVDQVVDGGAASKAGILHGDIITALNDVEITSISQLREKVNSLRVGTEVKIKYMRAVNGSYNESTVTVKLGQNPKLNSSSNSTNNNTNNSTNNSTDSNSNQ